MLDLPMLAQSIIDDGFCDGAGCWVGYGITGVVVFGLFLLIGRTRRRSEQAYWERRHREEEMRRNDPDMAPEE